MIFPMSMFPQTHPRELGWYLVHNKNSDIWHEAEWKEFQKLHGKTELAWQGRYDVDWFIPYRLHKGE